MFRHEGSLLGVRKLLMASVLVLVLFIGLALGAGALGSRPTMKAIPTWYASLNKPAWNPPNWLFAPVWTTLYILMAVAAWLVWKEVGIAADKLWPWLYFGQLALNVWWSFLFFGSRRPDWALIEIIVLWLAIFATLIVFWKISPVAGLMIVPYLAWVTFAGVLNATIVKLNPIGNNQAIFEDR